MFNIKICSLQESDYYIKNYATKTIRLLNTGLLHVSTDNVLVEHFDDNEIQKNGIFISDKQFTNILEFSETFTDDDKILVHCHAGISRSTSTAIAILIQHGMNYKDAFNKIAEIRPILYPNRTIVQMTDDYFNLNGEYVAFVNKWKNQNHEGFIIH